MFRKTKNFYHIIFGYICITAKHPEFEEHLDNCSWVSSITYTPKSTFVHIYTFL